MWGGERVAGAEGPGKIGGQFLRSSPLSDTLCLVTLPLHLSPPTATPPAPLLLCLYAAGKPALVARAFNCFSPRKSDLPLSAPKLIVSGNKYGTKRRESEGLRLFRF